MGKENREKYKFSSMTPLVLLGDDVIDERGNQGLLLGRELLDYNVILRDLAVVDLTYSIKNEILNIAFYIIGDIECYDIFISKKEIPIKRICDEFCKPRKYVERWRDSIVAYVIILGNNKYSYIKNYLSITEDKEESKALLSAFTEKNTELKGIVLSNKGKNARVITSEGDFKSIKVKEAVVRGQEVHGKLKKNAKDYKLQISILLFMVIVLLGVTAVNYINVVSTIMVKTTSPIIIEVNNFQRVKSIKCYTEKGQELIKSINVEDRTFDTALIEIIKYAEENEMIPFKGIIVTVSGKPIKQGNLHKTEDYVFIKQIDININNSGVEYKLN